MAAVIPAVLVAAVKARAIALVARLAAAIAFVPIPVPSLKLASFVPRMFHFAAEGCSPNTTLHET